MFYKKVISAALMGLCLLASAGRVCAQDAGGGFDKPFALSGKESIFIFTLAEAAKGGAGFVVYRAGQPGGEFSLVTASPVMPVKSPDQILSEFGPAAVDELAAMKLKSADEFWEAYKKKADMFEFFAWFSMPLMKVLGRVYEDRGVTPGGKYVYRVEVVDAAGKTIRKFDGITAEAVPPLIPPLTGFKGEVKDGAAKLTWNKNDGAKKATGIVIYRGNSPDGPYKEANRNIISLSGEPNYTDGGLANGMTYYYYGVMVDLVGNMSPQSDLVKIEPRDMTPPLPPMNVNVELKGDKPVLTWDMNLEPDLAGYDVYRSIEPQAGYATLTQAPVPGETTTYTDQTAEDGMPYYYRLTAVDKLSNYSTSSITVQVKLPDTIPPVQPLGLEGKPGGKNTIILTWKPGADRDLYGYYVYRGMAPDKLERAHMDVIPKDKPKFEDKAAVSGRTYYYALAAVDFSMNESAPTAPALKVVAPDSDPPDYPGGLFALAGDGKVTVSWAEGMESDIAGYRLYRSFDEAGKFERVGADMKKGTLQLVDEPAENGKKRWYYATAFDASGNESVPSGKVQATPYDDIAPQPPTGATGTLAAKTVRVKWAAPADKDISGYLICRTAASANGACETLGGGKPLTKQKMVFEDNTLAQGVQYWYRVIAVDTSGNKSFKSEPAGPFSLEQAAQAAQGKASAKSAAPKSAAPKKPAGGAQPKKTSPRGGKSKK